MIINTGDNNVSARRVVRVWCGATTAADADAYLEYLKRTGLAEYGGTPGNRGVLALRRSNGDRSEWMLLTQWDSEQAIRGFAGADVHQAVFYPEDDRFLIERDQQARHYEIAFVSNWDGEFLVARDE